jgi:GxxExxY protein
MEFDKLSFKVIGCALHVHSVLGPGMPEVVYEECLCYELKRINLKVERQLKIPVKYENIYLNCGYRLDLFVDDSLIVEIKVIEKIDRIHVAQILTYMRFANISLGLVINFSEIILRKA